MNEVPAKQTVTEDSHSLQPEKKLAKFRFGLKWLTLHFQNYIQHNNWQLNDSVTKRHGLYSHH